MNYIILIITLCGSIVELIGQDTISQKYIYDDYELLYKYYRVKDDLYRLNLFIDSNLIEESFVDTIFNVDFRTPIGEVKLYYADIGKIRGRGTNDNNGYSTRKWTYFYQNGAIAFVINYLRGVKHGCYREYYDNNVLKTVGRYNNPETGYARENYESKIGTWKYYYSSGQIKRKEQYWAGKAIKRFTEPIIRADGSINSNNELEVDESNKIILDIYKSSIKHGTWKYYDESGNLTKSEKYYKGKRIERKESGVPPQK